MKQVKKLVLSEMLSASKAVKHLQTSYSSDVAELLNAVGTIQNFLGKSHICEIVLDKFNSLPENEFVKFLDSQTAEKSRGNLNGSNVCERIINVAKRTKLA